MNLQKLIKKEKIGLPEAEYNISILDGEIREVEKKLAELKGKRKKVKNSLDEKNKKISALQKSLQATIDEAKKTS